MAICYKQNENGLFFVNMSIHFEYFSARDSRMIRTNVDFQHRQK